MTIIEPIKSHLFLLVAELLQSKLQAKDETNGKKNHVTVFFFDLILWFITPIMHYFEDIVKFYASRCPLQSLCDKLTCYLQLALLLLLRVFPLESV